MGGKRVGNSFVLTAKPRDGKDAIYATITKSVGVVECDSSGDTTEEQTVDTYVAIEKGGTAQALTGIVCKIDDSAELGTSYAAAGTPSPTINFKKSTVLNTGYVKIFIKSGTSFLSPTVIVITVSATVDGVSVSRKVTLTIQGNIHGPEGENGHNGQDGQDGNDAERYWIETGDGTREVRFTADFAGNVSGTPSYVSILLKHLKGSTEETLQSVPSGYTLEYLDDGGNWESFSPGSRNMGSDLSDGSYSPAVYRLRKGATELSRISIRAVWEYQRMLLPAGKYTSKEYTRTPTTTPLVLHEQSGEYWFLVKDTNKVGNSYVGPKDAGQTAWQKADDYDVVLTKMLFAQFAKLGGFIAYGFYFLSQYGTLIGPNSETAVRENNVNTEYAGYGAPPYVLNGGSVGNGYIVCKVSFYAQEGDKIGIRLTASSESGYDYGYVGALDDDTFAGMTSAGDILSQSGFMEASGTETVTQQVTIETTGIHYFYITYAKDGSQNKNSDNATFEFSGAEFRIKLVNRYNSSLTLTSASMARVPYGWFDPSDPMASATPASGYRFRPSKCINALSGEEWMAGGKVNVDKEGDVTMRNVRITGATMSHSVETFHSREYTVSNSNAYGKTTEYRLYQWDGVTVPDSDKPYYKKPTGLSMKCDHLFLVAVGAGAAGITLGRKSELRIKLPPAHPFVGQRILITNETTGYDDDKIIIEQDYFHDLGTVTNGNSDILVLTDNEFMDGGSYCPPSSYGDEEGVPWAQMDTITGESLWEAKGFRASGLWKAYEGGSAASNAYSYLSVVERELEIGEYAWLELTAVEGVFRNVEFTSSSYAWTLKALEYNAVWMLTRWEKKQ